MATLLVKTTTASDVAPISDVVVLAFSSESAARWTWPDPQQYLKRFPSFARAYGGKAFAELDHVKSDLPLMPEAGRSFIEQVILPALVRPEKLVRERVYRSPRTHSN
jgi:hypothetical protein